MRLDQSYVLPVTFATLVHLVVLVVISGFWIGQTQSHTERPRHIQAQMVDLNALSDQQAVQQQVQAEKQQQIESLYDRIRLLATQPLMGELRDDLRLGLRIFSAGRYVILYYPMK